MGVASKSQTYQQVPRSNTPQLPFMMHRPPKDCCLLCHGCCSHSHTHKRPLPLTCVARSVAGDCSFPANSSKAMCWWPLPPPMPPIITGPPAAAGAAWGGADS